MEAVERCCRGCRKAATAKAVAEKCHEKTWDGAGEQENAGRHCVAALSALTRTGYDAAIEALLSQGRATGNGGPSGCASDERAQRLIGWAETPKEGMINRHRGV